MKKIASQEMQLAADAKVFIVAKVQIMQDVKVEIEYELGFTAGVRDSATGKSARDGQKMIGDALHSGNDDGDTGGTSGGVNEARGMEHAARTEKRTAAKLESDDVADLFGFPAGAMHAMAQRGGAGFCCCIFRYVFEAHDLRSWIPFAIATAGASLEGA